MHTLNEAIDQSKGKGALGAIGHRSRLLTQLAVIACVAMAMPTLAAATKATAAPTEPRDGRHDFDFNAGVWRTHIRRIVDPFSTSSISMELNGTVTVRPIWGGRAWLEEIEADGPKGHWEGLTLFLYNPQAHQWSQTFANSSTGVLSPPEIGSFKDGRGVLVAQDTFNNRSILVRDVWSDIMANSHHMEESYSDDGGKTWHPAFIADLTRLSK